MTIETSSLIRRSPGRPRLQQTENRILDAAFFELCRSGYHGLTMDAVALRAGVGKPTVYRRYASKEHLAAAALSANLLSPKDIQTGSLKDDLAGMLACDLQWLRSPSGAPLLGALLAERQGDPWLMLMLQRKVIHPRQVQLAAAVERAVRRGEVNPDVNPSLVALAVWGALLAAVLAGTIPNQRGIEALAETVIRGIAR